MQKEYQIIKIYLLFFILLSIGGCDNKNTVSQNEFSEIHPGKPVALFEEGKIILKNKSIEAVWFLKDQSIHLKEVFNKYDNSKVNFENTVLFEIELDNGERFDNSQFKLQDELKISNLASTDSLPTKALTFSGKEISGNFISEDKNISIRWSALLREGSNYIRQNIEITAIDKPIKITKVTFFDGELKGAKYAGSVLGSPIVYNNFFFGLEHPIAKSDALFSRTIGGISDENIDISYLVDSNGEYVIAYEHGGGSDDFNINSISLLKDGKIIITDQHVLNGYEGSSLYKFQIDKYDNKSKYEIKLDFSKYKNATGVLHLYRKTDNILNFYVNREDELIPGKSISEWVGNRSSFRESKKKRLSVLFRTGKSQTIQTISTL